MAYAYQQRARRIEALLDVNECDAVLLSNLADVRWACGFTGSSGMLLALHGTLVFVTDGRYRTQASNEVFADEVLIAETDMLDALLEILDRFAVKSVIAQSDNLTVERFEKLRHLAPSIRHILRSGLLREMRASKEVEEVKQIQKALEITESVLESVLDIIRPGISERDLAAELEYRQKLSGAEGASFDTIVAFGPNGALPHARAGSRILKADEPVLIDFGCVVNGYSSDLTRTLYLGHPSDRFCAVYDVVRMAVDAAEQYACAGQLASELDRAGRETIDDAGFGKEFVHSLGHGVGLEIHEWPRINKQADDSLPMNSVITIEPGIYLPAEFGIRIEDMIVLEAGGCRRLNRTSTELIIV